MRQLLDERTAICIYLGLTSKRPAAGGIPLNREVLANNFSSLFRDSPENLSEYGWAIIEDRGSIYGLIASEEKYVPLCKQCNYTIYISLRGTQGRIVCGNPKCKTKLLG